MSGRLRKFIVEKGFAHANALGNGRRQGVMA
jgi:hypothetical protein